MIIKNEELIKKLIKENFNIPLNKLEKIDFVITETKSKDIEDWKKVSDYLKWYTNKTIKLEHPDWKIDRTFQLYYQYLYSFKDIKEKDIFPKEDIYYLTEELNNIKRAEEEKMKKELLKKVKEGYKKAREYSFWDNSDM